MMKMGKRMNTNRRIERKISMMMMKMKMAKMLN
jgi:hypothetical protein